MTYSFMQDVPIDAALYRRITDAIGDEPAEASSATSPSSAQRAVCATSTCGSPSRTLTASPKSGFIQWCAASSVSSSATNYLPNLSASRSLSFACGNRETFSSADHRPVRWQR